MVIDIFYLSTVNYTEFKIGWMANVGGVKRGEGKKEAV